MPAIANIPQGKFLAMPHKYRAFVAGYGCLKGDTQVITINGLVPISGIDRPTLILSLNEKSNQLEFCQGGPSFPKGEDSLYRIATTQGEFVAAGFHRVFCDDYKYRPVEDLTEGQGLFLSFQNQQQTSSVRSKISLKQDVSCCSQKFEDLKNHYVNVGRPHGQRLHEATIADLCFAQQQADAQGYGQGSYLEDTEHMGDFQEQKQEHNHQGQLFFRTKKTRSMFLLGRLEAALGGRVSSSRFECIFDHILKYYESSLKLFCHHKDSGFLQLCNRLFYSLQSYFQPYRHAYDVVDQGLSSTNEHRTASSQQAMRLLLQFVHHHKTVLQDQFFSRRSPFVNESRSTTKTNHIVSIKREKVKDVYWDIQVDKNHNYLTKDGTVHHNSGKTWVGCMSSGIHYLEHPGVNQGYFAPTYGHIRDIYFPTVEESVFDLGLNIDIKEGNKEVHFYTGKVYRGTTICRSMDKPQNIIGFKIGHALIDEIDILPTNKAQTAWQKIIARMRHNEPGLKNGIDITTTPEGFKFAHKTFVQAPSANIELKHNYGLIQASTYDNEANLPDDYIQSLIETYPAELIDAYLNGQFVNLTSGTVYRNYDRVRCESNETIQPNEVLNIGMDFNVEHMAACIFVVRNNGWHAVDELKDIYDTPAMIKIIQERFQGHKIKIYPDASGNSRKSNNASESDITLLRQAGFRIMVGTKNPFVKDRILSTNKQFEIGNLWVNNKSCPVTSRCLEQQAYDSNGEPDKKSGFDHQNDAFSYPIAYEFPIRPKGGITQSTW